MSRASSRGSVMPSAPDGPITPSTPEPSPPEPSSLELPAAALVEVWLEVAAVETVLAAALLERLAPAGVAIRLPFKQGLDFGGAEISPDGLARVSCYLPVSAWTALRSSLEATVAAGEWLGAAPQLRSTPLPDTNWATAWHAYVHVQRFGRLVLRPTPCPYVPQPGRGRRGFGARLGLRHRLAREHASGPNRAGALAGAGRRGARSRHRLRRARLRRRAPRRRPRGRGGR